MKKLLKNFNIIGFIMLMVCVVLGVGDVSGAIMANGVGTEMDGSEIQTSDGKPEGDGAVIQHGRYGALETTDLRRLTPEMIEDPIDQRMVMIRPYDVPLDTLLRYMGTLKTNSFEFGWYGIGSRKVVDAINGTVTLNPGATAQDFRGEMGVANIGLYYPTQTLGLPTVADSDGDEIMVYVYEVDKTNKTVKFTAMEDQLVDNGNGYTLPQTPSSGDDINIYGRAGAELDVTTPATSYLPKKSKGFCQIFKTQIAQSAYEKLMDKEIKFDLSEIEEQALWEHRRYMNGTLLFGRGGHKIYDPNKDTYIYTTEGVVRTVKKLNGVQTLNTANGTDALVDMMEKIFTRNNGSKERFAMLGKNAMTKLTKLQYSKLTKQIGAAETEVIGNIRWNKLVDNFGQLNFIHNDAFDDYGYSDYILVIDPQFLKKWQLTNFERQVVDAKELTIMNGTMVIFTEACGVAVYNPPVHSLWKVV